MVFDLFRKNDKSNVGSSNEATIVTWSRNNPDSEVGRHLLDYVQIGWRLPVSDVDAVN